MSNVAAYLVRFGCVLNADDASELFPDYAASPQARARLGPSVRAAAGRIVDDAYLWLLGQPVPEGKSPLVVFTSGGNGSGKTSSVARDGVASVVFDSTLSLPAPSIANIDRALAAGRDVYVRHISRHPIEAWLGGVLPRAMNPRSPHPGRTVPVTSHVRTHAGARATVLALADRYAGDARVRIDVWQNQPSRLEQRAVDWLRQQAYPEGDVLRDELLAILDAEFAAARIDAAVYLGCGGQRRDVPPGEP